jgi:hypothetical protein
LSLLFSNLLLMCVSHVDHPFLGASLHVGGFPSVGVLVLAFDDAGVDERGHLEIAGGLAILPVGLHLPPTATCLGQRRHENAALIGLRTVYQRHKGLLG